MLPAKSTPVVFIRIRSVLIMAMLTSVVSPPLSAATCSLSLTDSEKARLVAYVSRKYRVSERAQLRIEDEHVANDACYHELTLQGEGSLGVYRLKLYVSPDLRFLSSEILDSHLDPAVEERQHAVSTLGELPRGEYATRGSLGAPLTLVIFSDFQCPYCRNVAALLKAEPFLQSGDNVRLVFRHMPMARHDWAQRASEAAACAQFQSSTAFWTFRDQFFAHQNEISVGNIATFINESASTIPGLDLGKFQTCLAKQLSLGVVLRDRQLGLQAGVIGTPVAFINGRQVGGFSSAGELHSLLEKSLQDEIPTAPTLRGREAIRSDPEAARQR